MSIKPLNHHYSMENPASVYDEEAMTALELAGRTTSKVNEVVKIVNDFLATIPETVRKLVVDKVLGHIQDGEFDKQIDKYAGELKARLDNLIGETWAGSLSSMDAELVDIRLGADRMEYDTAGEAIRNQYHVLAERFTNEHGKPFFKVHDIVDGEYFSTSNGGYGKSDTYRRSRNLIPCPAGAIMVCPEMREANQVLLTCYDRDFTFLGYIQAVSSNCGGTVVKATPYGTAYVGATIKANLQNEYITLQALDNTGLDYVQDPFIGANTSFLLYDGYWMHSSGMPAVSENYKTIVFPVDGIKTVYTNASIQINAIFYDQNNGVISTGESYTQHTTGRSYTVPSEAVYVAFNILTSHTHGDKLSQYVSLIREATPTERLRGKKILCIGDSITWLDGKSGFDGASDFLGWQTMLRKRGALVDSLGYNNLGYAGADSSTSIYQAIVASDWYNLIAYQPEDYDAVILFGGSNDIRDQVPYYKPYYTMVKLQETPINPLPDETTVEDNFQKTWYKAGGMANRSNTFYDAGGVELDMDTYFEPGLDALTEWVMTQFENATIFLCTPIHRASMESAGKYEHYIRSIRTHADCINCPVIDLYRLSGINQVNYANWFYDTVHPNKKGMEKIGHIIAEHVNSALY